MNQQEASHKGQEEKTTKEESLAGWFLEGVLLIQDQLLEEFPRVAGHIRSAANHDDFATMVEATLQERRKMGQEGKPVGMDVGYHFTRPANMVDIRKHGLLTHQERQARDIHAHHNGSAFGDGIYTANDTTYAEKGKYGDTGLMVARLKGIGSSNRAVRHSVAVPHDSFVTGDVVVLRKSSQCLVLMEFDRSLLQDPRKERAIWVAHGRLEHLLDVCLRGAVDPIGLVVLRQPKAFLEQTAHRVHDWIEKQEQRQIEERLQQIKLLRHEQELRQRQRLEKERIQQLRQEYFRKLKQKRQARQRQIF